MQFQVPQFIEVEDRVFGPLTVKQFFYLIGGACLCYLLYHFLDLTLALIPMIIVAGLSIALAFYKYNNRPFIDFLESSFNFYTRKKLYLWRKDFSAQQKVAEQKALEKSKKQSATSQQNPTVYVPTLSQSKLKDLAWSLDIKENTNPVTGNSGITNTR